MSGEREPFTSKRFALIHFARHERTQRYVRVMGRLKVYNGVNQLNAEQIRPILDMHEPFFHFLEAIVAFVSNQRISVRNTRCSID